jgi:hypothetical protein
MTSFRGNASLAKMTSPGAEITKVGRITAPLTSCLTGLDLFVLQIKTKIVSCHTTDSKPVSQEVNGTVNTSPFSISCLGAS